VSTAEDIARPAELELREADVDADPFRQFAVWFREAQETVKAGEPGAMTLATATPGGTPSARVVLLRGFDERGFVFYTNYESQKGQELAENPRAALVFYWGELRRQVRLTGVIEKTSREESERYYAGRPFGSQLEAWTSRQSTVIPDRATLEARFAELEAEYGGKSVSLPPYWGGYRLVPSTFEFWQSRINRLHDRLRYSRRPDGGWTIERLSP
jgi:pyridoxamine 5'-phosphate oxidase